MNHDEIISQQEMQWFNETADLDKDATEVVLVPTNSKIGKLIVSPVESYLVSIGFKLSNPELEHFSMWKVDMVGMTFTRERWGSGLHSTPSMIKRHLEEKKTRLNAKRSGLID